MAVIVSKEIKVPVLGKLLSDLAVGEIVKLNENGNPVEYIVVNQGIPSGSSLYDKSCDGTWLQRKNVYEKRAWHSTNLNMYASSTIHTYLNGTFLALFDNNTQKAMKTVKIPYSEGNATSTVYSGSSGLSTKIFLLSDYEIGWTTAHHPAFSADGAKLDYFVSETTSDANKCRVAYLSGAATDWWTRSPSTSYNFYTWRVLTDGTYGDGACSTAYGVRPAIVFPKTALFDEKTLLFKEVS